MVSNRCKMVVKEELNKLGIFYMIVDMGVVDIMDEIDESKREEIRKALHQSGLELMDDKKSVLIEKIKQVIIEMIHYDCELPKVNFSDYLSQKLNYDYTYMANMFSEVQGTTIEKCIIAHKIERVKELIMYNEFNLTEIAWKMQYSSVSHLSNQFKKVTGLTPSHFKNMKDQRRIPLEDL